MKKPYSYQFYSTTSEAWDAMYQALLGAKKSIFWEIFIFIDDQVGAKFIRVLVDKAKAGLDVKLVVDAAGSRRLSRKGEKVLKEAGVDLLWFHRLMPDMSIRRWINRVFFRNHRKVLVADEETAFLGGVNIDAKTVEWDDLYLRMQGKVVHPLLRGFAKSYISAGGQKKKVKHLLHPKLLNEWQDLKESFSYILHGAFRRKRSPAKRLYVKAIEMAKETVNLITPYYVPDRHFLKALAKAKRRGVKVNLFLPMRTDHKFMAAIARTYYGLTESLGANIYFLPKMNHGKAISVDDKMGIVGSFNLTPRSLNSDAEVGVSFKDTKMVGDLNNLFNDWKKEATIFDKAAWSKRGFWMKTKEWWAKRLEKYV
jgi:cardiolipin synthase A/B